MNQAKIEYQGKTDKEREVIINSHKKTITEKSNEILLDYGFKAVKQDRSSTVGILSTSSDINLTDEFSYDASTGLYRFSGNWNFVDYKWDDWMDLEDLAAARMTNPTGYQVYSSFARSWDNFGLETGYVDNTGQQTPQNSYVTKRFEDSAGVIFNVRDYVTVAHIYNAYADSGRVTMYFSKTTGGSNKVFLDYHHNYKSYSTTVAASFNNIGLSGAGYSLNVSYTKANQNWQRSSGGRIVP
jgi:hypothetical protein